VRSLDRSGRVYDVASLGFAACRRHVLSTDVYNVTADEIPFRRCVLGMCALVRKLARRHVHDGMYP